MKHFLLIINTVETRHSSTIGIMCHIIDAMLHIKFTCLLYLFFS